jgi:hypothetical protein
LTIQSQQFEGFEKIQICVPATWLIKTAQEIGKDFSSLNHEYTSDTIKHSMGGHSDPKTHGSAALILEDFQRIACIVQEPNFAIIGAVRRVMLINAYAKINDGMTYMYFEEILQSRKNNALRGLTLYKISKPVTLIRFINTVTMNGKTDMSKAKVIAAGGNPDG